MLLLSPAASVLMAAVVVLGLIDKQLQLMNETGLQYRVEWMMLLIVKTGGLNVKFPRLAR
jgi:hypothetical protein